jgi:cytochrome P450
VATLGDFYFAGSDTTSTTLAWMILYLSKFPDIQAKFQAEIESITGNSRMISLSDRPKYVQIIVDDIFAICFIVQLACPTRKH